MTYKSYEARIQRIAKATKGLRRCAKLIVALVVTAILATGGCLFAKGMVFGGVTCAPAMDYGDTANPSCFVFWGSADYQYAAEGSEEWSSEPPVLPGKYMVRAVTSRTFGGTYYSDPTHFTIRPKKITVTVREDSIPYGGVPTVTAELREGDRIEGVSLEFNNLALSPNTPVHISAKTIRIVNEKGEDVTSAYELTTLDKVVAVVPRPITITTADGVKEYDGAPLLAEQGSLTEGSLIEGDTLTVGGFPSSVISVTEEAVENSASEIVIRNADGEEVTNFYNVTTLWGSLTVKPRSLSVKTENLSWTYLRDRTPVAGDPTVGEDTPLPEGHSLVGGEVILPTVPGEYRDVRQLTVLNGEGEDVTANFIINEGREDHENWGVINVAPCPLVVTTPDGEKEGGYDGTPYSFIPTTPEAIEEMFLAGEVLPFAGHTVVIEEKDATAVTNVTPEEGVENRFTIRILEGSVDVTETHYAIEYRYGRLKIEPKELTVMTFTAALPYNGRPQSYVDGVQESVQEQLPAGHSSRIETVTEVTDCSQGEQENVVTVCILNAKGEDVTGNFAISASYGTISVEPLPIAIAPTTVSRPYNGMALVSGGAVTAVGSPNQIPNEGYTIEITDLDSDDPLVNVGIKTVTDYGYVIRDKDGNDITANFNLEGEGSLAPGIFEVTPLPITARPADVKKLYDGLPLTAADVIVEGLPDNLKDDDKLQFVAQFMGEKTVVGTETSSIIALAVYYDGFDVTHCFDVTAQTGVLTVEPRQLVLTTNSPAPYTYNGLPQGENSADVDAAIRGANEGVLLPGWTLEISEIATITNVPGEGEEILNRVSVLVKDENGADITPYFDLIEEFGRLTMEKRSLTVKPLSATKIYDGHSLNGFEKYSPQNILSELGHKLVLPEDKSGFVTITNVGEVANELPADGYKVMATGVDLTANYDIRVMSAEEAGAKLTVTPRTITLALEPLELVYDGELHALSFDVTSKLNFLEMEGTDEYGAYLVRHELVYKPESMKDSVTDTPYTYGPSDYTVISTKYRTEDGSMNVENTEDVTSNYTLDVGQGATLTITPRPVTLATAGSEKVFDGLALTAPSLLGSPENLVEGHFVSPDGFASITEVGETDNTCTVRILDGDRDVTANYAITVQYGTLKVTTLFLSVSTDDHTREFNGTPLTGGVGDVSIATLPGTLTFEAIDFHSVTFVGETENACSVIIRDGNGVDVTKQCEISYSFGTLKIDPLNLTVTMESRSKSFDGTSLIGSLDDLRIDNLPGTLTFEAGGFHSVTFVGETENACSVIIRDESGADVSEQCRISYVYGTLTIEPRTLVITTESHFKYYDGAALVGTESDLQIDNLPDTLTYDVSGFVSVVKVTEEPVKNSCDIIIRDANGADVTDQCILETNFGTLTIGKCPITVAILGHEKEYDGTPLTGSASDLSVVGLPANHTFAGGNFAFITEVAEIPNECDLKIFNGKGEDVTDQFDITRNVGYLKITPRALSVTSPDGTKEYDGTPLVTDPNLLTVEGLLPGHWFTAQSLASQIYAYELDGQYQSEENQWKLQILDGNGNDVTDQYDYRAAQWGRLIITRRQITVTTPDLHKAYDGIPLSVAKEQVLVENLVFDHSFDIVSPSVLYDAGPMENKCTVTITDSHGEDVTEQHEIAYVYGTLSMGVGSITVSTPSYEKIYDGTPLTSSADEIEVIGLSDVLRLSVSGDRTVSITDVGLQVNSYVIRVLDAEDNDVTHMFDIDYQFGHLVVNPRKLIVTTPSDTKEYDGTALTADPALVAVEGLAPGHSFIATTDASITEPGQMVNTLKDWQVTCEVDGETVTVTDNYIIENCVEGVLTVTPPAVIDPPAEPEPGELIHLEIVPEEIVVTYDGKLHGPADFWISEGQLPAGYTIINARYTEPHVEVGEYVSRVLSVTILNADGVDVTDTLFDVDYRETTMQIKARSMTVTTPSKSKYYDGTPLLSDPDAVEVIGLCEGHVFSVMNDVSITQVGQTENRCTVTVFDENGLDVTSMYDIKYRNGTLSIVGLELRIESPSVEKEYDGTPLVGDPDSITWDGLAEGHSIQVLSDVSITNVGSVQNVFRVIITDENGNDLTDRYNIVYRFGNLTVRARPLTVTAPSAVKRYDGKPLYGEVIIDRLADGHSVEVFGFTSITDVGSVENRCEVILRDANGNDVTDQYAIDFVFGTLTVKEPMFTLTTPDESKEYDGTPLSSNLDDIRVSGLVNGHSYVLENTVSITEIGSVENTCDITILDEYGNDVTDMYEKDIHFGFLIISARTLTVNTPTVNKEYDGTPLVSNPNDVIVEGLLEGHTVDLETNGSITEIGIVDNVCEVKVLDANGADVSHLYDIQMTVGTLEVTLRALQVVTPGMSKPYDGIPLVSDPGQITVSGILAGHTYVLENDVSITDIGEVENACVITVFDAMGNDVTSLYYDVQNNFGKLTIRTKDPIQLAIRPYEVSVTYDGRPHGPSNWWITSDQKLPDGYTVTEVVYSEPFVNAGTHTARILSLTILNAKGEDVTDAEFDIEFENAYVRIYPRAVTIETGSLTAKFDGGVHKNQTHEIVGGDLLPGHTLEVTIKTTIRDYNPDQVTYNVVEHFEICDEEGNVVLEGRSGNPANFSLQRDPSGNVMYAYEVFEGGNYRFVIRYGTLNLTWR